MITRPMPFKEAILYLLNKDPNPSEWDSTMWAAEYPAVKVRSFFSAKVENARFLDRAQAAIFDYMARTTEEVVGPDGVTRRALRTTGRADFVRQMRQFMVREGMATEKELWLTDQNDIEDIKSEARLRLIFDTNVRQAYGYGQWRQGMTPAVRRAFPAARFVRVRGVGIPRPRHAAHEGEIRKKTDTAWWARYQNDPQIGGFGVPWGPYGFGSGMGQEDVSADELRRQGIDYDVFPSQWKKPTDGPAPADDDGKPFGLNSKFAVTVRNMDPEVRRRLIEELQGGLQPERIRVSGDEIGLE